MPVSVYPASFNLTNFNGRNDFIINGINAGDQSSAAVASAGSVNDDKLDDILIVAPLVKFIWKLNWQ